MIENNMTRRGDTVCIGLSGGADSVCLLILLNELAREMSLTITAFHVNHSLRGEESDGDEAYVRELCASLNVPLKCFRYDIAAIAADNKKGLEETGRIWRRKAAAEAAGIFQAGKIAFAHHANDNAETVLFNMARGSSAGGLKGILPVSGSYIRPLLCLERSEIEEELKSRGIAWREDSTNAATDYSRNMLRNVVIPALTENINAAAVRHINAAALDCAEAFEMVRDIANERLEQYSERTENGILLKTGILTGKRLIDGRIALCALESVTHSAVDLTRVHARDLTRLFEKQTGRVIELPYGTCAERVYEGVRIRKNKVRENGEHPGAEPLPEGGTLEFAGLLISTEIIKRSEIPYKIPENRYTKWFDYDRINGRGIIRTALPGDFLVINSEGGKKSLKKFFTDEKVPREKRNRVVCIAAGSEILWVIGYRMGWGAKITEDTKKVLKVDITGAVL